MTFIRERKRGNNIYLEEVKSIRRDGKVRQVHVRYVGKKVDDKTILSGSINRAKISRVSIHGPLLLLHGVCKLLEIDKILGDDAPLVLCLVYGHCVQPGSLSWIKKWFSRTDLNKLLDIEDVTYDRLLKALDNLESKSMSVQRRMYDAATEKFNISVSSMFYDVTNVYFYGCSCLMAKTGYNKEGMKRPEVQIGLAVTKEEKIPIFHKVFDGNIHDAKTINDILPTFRELQINKITLIWDRGVSSEKNIKDAKALGCEVICGIPLNKTLEDEIKETVSSYSLGNLKNRIQLKNSILYVHQRRYKYCGVSGYLNICLNKKDKLSRTEGRRREIASVIEAKKKGETIPAKWKKYIKYKNINQDVLNEVEKYDGISLIFSTKKLPKEKVIKAYFEKDMMEKTFRTMKSALEVRPIRHWLKNRVKSHILICYMAYYFLSIIEYKLRKMNLTATEALDILSTAYRVEIEDPKTRNKFSKTVTLSKEQERILKVIDWKMVKRSG